jgi:probable rRNA maturation factor
MARMKKHPFLHVEYTARVKFSKSEERQLRRYLDFADHALRELIKKGVLPGKKVKGLEVSLLICGDSTIRKLNLEHRRKDKVTDVLSFPAHENLRAGTPPGERLFLGDLAICHPQTKRQAKKYKVGYWDEFIHLFVHGIIHLMGYDHEVSEAEEKVMELWEKRALDKISEIKKGP